MDGPWTPHPQISESITLDQIRKTDTLTPRRRRGAAGFQHHRFRSNESPRPHRIASGPIDLKRFCIIPCDKNDVD
jgi:hypothetical protein